MKHTQDKPPPSNISAEKAILGCILMQNEFFEMTKCLEADDFSLDAHRIIYIQMAEMLERGDAVDPITLVDELANAKMLERVGNLPIAYITDLNADTIRYQPSVKNWVRIVKGKSLQRRLILVCQSALNKSYEGESGWGIIAFLRENLDEIEASAKRGTRNEST